MDKRHPTMRSSDCCIGREFISDAAWDLALTKHRGHYDMIYKREQSLVTIPVGTTGQSVPSALTRRCGE